MQEEDERWKNIQINKWRKRQIDRQIKKGRYIDREMNGKTGKINQERKKCTNTEYIYTFGL